MSLTIEEGRILADAVKKSGGVLQVGSQQRSEWAFRKAAELVRNGYIGNIHTIKPAIGEFPPEPKNLKEEPIPEGFNYDKWLGQTPWRPYNAERVLGNYGGGWRRFYEYGIRKDGDWGAHHFDIIQWALGMDDSGPTDFYPENSDGSEFRHYRYANGPTVYVNTPMKNNHMIHFIGDEGEILVSRGARIETSPSVLRSIPMRAKDIRLQVSDDHRKNFLDAIIYGKKNICPADIESAKRDIYNPDIHIADNARMDLQQLGAERELLAALEKISEKKLRDGVIYSLGKLKSVPAYEKILAIAHKEMDGCPSAVLALAEYGTSKSMSDLKELAGKGSNTAKTALWMRGEFECGFLNPSVLKEFDNLDDNLKVAALGLLETTPDFCGFVSNYKAKNKRVAIAQCYALARMDSADDSCARKIISIAREYGNEATDFAPALACSKNAEGE